MTQRHAPANLYVVRFRRETTFGANSGGTQHRIHVLEGFSHKATETQIPVKELRSRLAQRRKNVHGPRRGTINLPLHLRAHASQLNAAASVPSVPSPNGEVLRTALGGWNAGRGSTVQASSTTSTVKVATGHGSRFWVGEAIAVEVSGELEICFVAAISTDDLTVYPSLTATPTTSGVVIASQQYYWSDTSRESASIEVAEASAVSGTEDAQYEYLGAHATGFTLETKIEADVTFSVALESAGFTGPEALSQSTADEADTQSDPFVYMDSQLWLAQSDTIDRTHTTHHTAAFKIDTGMVAIKDGKGLAKSNRAGVVRTGNPNGAVEFEMPSDFAYLAEYDSKTSYMAVQIHKIGTGTSARFAVVSCPCLVLDERPDHGEESNRVTTPLKFGMLENDDAVWTGSDDKSRSPFSIYLL